MSTSSASGETAEPTGIEPTLEAVFEVCPGGSPPALRRRRLLQVLGLAPDCDPSIEVRVKIWLASLVLLKLDEQQDSAWDWIGQTLTDEAVTVPLAVACSWSDRPPPVLTMTGKSHLAMTFVNRAYDVATGAWVTEIPTNWARTELYNIRTLFTASEARMTRWIRQQQSRGQTPTPQPSPSFS